MEKFFVVAHFGDKTYADGGIALVRDSQTNPGTKEIMAVGVWCGGIGYIVEEWPASTYKSIVDYGLRLELDDSVWDAVIRLREAEKSDSKKYTEEAVSAFENLIGVELKVGIHLGGAR